MVVGGGRARVGGGGWVEREEMRAESSPVNQQPGTAAWRTAVQHFRVARQIATCACVLMPHAPSYRRLDPGLQTPTDVHNFDHNYCS